MIPVLFLALAVQGRTYENLVKTFRDAHQRWITPGPSQEAEQAPCLVSDRGELRQPEAALVRPPDHEVMHVRALQAVS